MGSTIRRRRLLLTLSGGLALPAHAAPDKDGDGIANRKDRCPDAAEDVDGFLDDDGCPDPDNDGDGVADRLDDCPMEPGPTGCAMSTLADRTPAPTPPTPTKEFHCEGTVAQLGGAFGFHCTSGASGTFELRPIGDVSLVSGEGSLVWNESGDRGVVGVGDVMAGVQLTPATLPTTAPASTDDTTPVDPGATSSQSPCFLTTAVSVHRGQPDDGPVLTALRAYRDRYLMADPDRARDVDAYYAIAPDIVRAVQARPDAGRVWDILYADYLVPILGLLRQGEDARAHEAYRLMVSDLAQGLGVKTA